jgi:methylglutaconyl-CoA hydratase
VTVAALVLDTELGSGIAELTLNRPEQRNALDAALIAELAAALERRLADPATRVIVLAGSGTSFCAGADLKGMRAIGQGPRAASVADAEALATLLRTVHGAGKPVIARVQGPAFGGGLGLVAACDIAVASTDARFRLPEVQLGVVPAVISPYVIEAIGVRQARRYFLSGEAIAPERAREIGLVHELVAPEALVETTLAVAREVLKGGPGALAAAKTLISEVAGQRPGAALARRTAEILADLRAGAEAQEGLASALERRSPNWRG